MWIGPSIGAELMRSRMQELERAAIEHHRTKRPGKSPRRPGPGTEACEH